MNINLEKKHFECVLKMREGYTLGVVDTLLIHAMATSLQKASDKPVFAWHAVDVRTGAAYVFTDLDGVNQALANNAYLEVTPLFTERQSVPVITDIARLITDNDKLMTDINRDQRNNAADTARKELITDLLKGFDTSGAEYRDGEDSELLTFGQICAKQASLEWLDVLSPEVAKNTPTPPCFDLDLVRSLRRFNPTADIISFGLLCAKLVSHEFKNIHQVCSYIGTKPCPDFDRQWAKYLLKASNLTDCTSSDDECSTSQPGNTLSSLIDDIIKPISPVGLDPETHHCEYALYQDRERIRKALYSVFDVTLTGEGDMVKYKDQAEESGSNSPEIPEGYKLVPEEPTDEMIAAFYKMDFRNADTAYKAMIAAAPNEPVMESAS